MAKAEIYNQFVKLFVKSNKNDFVDAEAIAFRVPRPPFDFIQVRCVLYCLHALLLGTARKVSIACTREASSSVAEEHA